MTWNNPVNWVDPSGMSVAMEQRALYGIGLGAAEAITLHGAYPLIVRLMVRQGTRYVLQEVAKTATFNGQGMGCLIGLQLSSIGATILGATTADIAQDGCSVVAATRPYAGETPDDRPDNFDNTREGKRSKSDGSIWDNDHSGHGGSKWKRWPSSGDKERGRGRESVRPDGSVR